jgi:hypothetical protein
MRIIYAAPSPHPIRISALSLPQDEKSPLTNSPNKTKHALNAATTTGYPDSLMIPKITGIVADPMRATNPLILVYGTCSSSARRVSVNTILRITPELKGDEG